jgi:hypothetical protein
MLFTKYSKLMKCKTLTTVEVLTDQVTIKTFQKALIIYMNNR